MAGDSSNQNQTYDPLVSGQTGQTNDPWQGNQVAAPNVQNNVPWNPTQIQPGMPTGSQPQVPTRGPSEPGTGLGSRKGAVPMVYAPGSQISPEVGPISTQSQEGQALPPEYGYDIIKKIETRAEQIERKEAKPQPQPGIPQAPKSVAQPQQPPVSAQPQLSPLKLFGYKISPLITNNYQLISSQKGKGDPNTARTWIYILLDRLLKKTTLMNTPQ